MTIHVDTTSAEEAVILMDRMFDAPREVVWNAFTDPKHVVNWYGGHGFSSPVCEMDVRPGGRWRHTMRTPDGTDFPMEFVYVEVVRPEKISWQNVDHGKRVGGPPTCLNIVTFEDHGSRTKWRLVSRFNSIADRDLAAKMGFTKMISQGSERLNEIVKSLTRESTSASA
jgi:uncharacterized protein YndB with AHSA1/START domain